MTKDEHVKRLCYKYKTLARMNHENLAYRIKYEALGKSNPDKLAAKLLALKDGAKVDPKAPEDEAIWADAMLTLLPVAPIPAPAEVIKPAAKSPKADAE
jgi:hypothetical protein